MPIIENRGDDEGCTLENALEDNAVCYEMLNTDVNMY